MANFTTVIDLCDDALFMAGEDVAANVSPWYDRAPELLSAVMDAIVSGAPLGDQVLTATDWWWSRKARRGGVTIYNAFNEDGAESAAFVQGSDNVDLTPGTTSTESWPTGVTIDTWLVKVANRADHTPRILTHGVPELSPITLGEVWLPESITTTDWIAFQLDHTLPSDFVQFTGHLQHGRDPYVIEVTDANTLEERYPLGRISAGTPQLAALVDATTLRFSHYISDGPMRVEFEYEFDPAALTRGGTDPVIPHHFRRILSYGAAYLIMWERRDNSRGEAFRLFAGAWDAMSQENYKQTMGPNYGQIIARPNRVASRRWPLRTASGNIIG